MENSTVPIAREFIERDKWPATITCTPLSKYNFEAEGVIPLYKLIERIERLEKTVEELKYRNAKETDSV